MDNSSKPITDDGKSSQAMLLKKLSELPPKSRRTRSQTTLKEFIAVWYEHLKSAYDRGYTYEELAELLSSEGGVSITAGTLRKYMANAKRQLASTDSSFTESANTPLITPKLTISTAPKQPQSGIPRLDVPLKQRISLTSRSEAQDIRSEFHNL